MSEFVNHSICGVCFSYRYPGRVPVRVSTPLKFCCACGIITNDGILVRGQRHAEQNCTCPVHKPDPETHPEAVMEQCISENDGTVCNWACSLGERKPRARTESIVYASNCKVCLILHEAHLHMFSEPLKSLGYEADGSTVEYKDVLEHFRSR